jgi:uncharacterized protein (DUF58 family)
VLATLAALTDGAWLFLLAAGALGLAVTAVLFRPRPDGLRCTLDAPVRAVAGVPVTHVVTVRNTASRPTPPVRVTHHAAGYDDVTVAVRPLRPGESASVELRRVPRGRAHATLHGFTVTSSAPLGLLRTTGRVDVAGPLVVHPAPVPVPAQPRRDADAADGPTLPARDGLDPGGVREWRTGDGSRRVHWRSTARRGRLVVTEPERPRSARLVVVLSGPAGTPDWEHLVSAVASVGLERLRAGGDVALLARGHGLAEGAGILDWCAALGNPGPPDAAILRRALAWAGPDGDVLLAAPTGRHAEVNTLLGGRLALFRTSAAAPA